MGPLVLEATVTEPMTQCSIYYTSRVNAVLEMSRHGALYYKEMMGRVDPSGQAIVFMINPPK